MFLERMFLVGINSGRNDSARIFLVDLKSGRMVGMILPECLWLILIVVGMILPECLVDINSGPNDSARMFLVGHPLVIHCRASYLSYLLSD